ncbi:polyphosphate polymerase domain-containing protein [Streptococcus ovis]|uniref:polyphosphate polymerase domain-containing protein n=1 Tax=Streptococcus ovis TaxID=82806 RepID=UPI00036F96C9|nr:polyphosphate polymerase domain-containing protein [Streptococcus ovis]
MSQTLQTTFKRIETKYIIEKENLATLMADLKHYLTEDDHPTSTITNIYFDTENFDVIKDALAGRNLREKIRMRSYLSHPTSDSQAFLEVKQKDAQGVGHKFRIISTPAAITNLLTTGTICSNLKNSDYVNDILTLRKRYDELIPRIFISYDRFSLKQKKDIEDKVRITFDQNLCYRDYQVTNYQSKESEPLMPDNQLIMEIKAAEDKPAWLQEILDKHKLTQIKFSKYTAAYHKSQNIPYSPRPALVKERGLAHA